MFGNNLKRPVVKGDGRSLSIKSIFKTLQAEGPYWGIPAIFIRLGGCNLACSFCDTEFEDYLEKSLDEIIGQVEHLSKNSNKIQSIFLVVITGGEPLLGWQRSYPDLLQHEQMRDLKEITFETNGTMRLTKDFKEYLSKWKWKHEGFIDREITFSVSAKLPASGEPCMRGCFSAGTRSATAPSRPSRSRPPP